MGKTIHAYDEMLKAWQAAEKWAVKASNFKRAAIARAEQKLHTSAVGGLVIDPRVTIGKELDDDLDYQEAKGERDYYFRLAQQYASIAQTEHLYATQPVHAAGIGFVIPAQLSIDHDSL